jgi:hypothetical protein
MVRRLFSLIIVAWFTIGLVTAQDSVRLTVIDGGNVSFNFNSLSKYNNGITYANYTTFGIAATDAAPVNGYNNGWELFVKALSNQLDGSVLANTLNLNTIELSPTITAGPATIVNPTITLSNADQLLVRSVIAIAGPDPNPTTDQISITYNVGVTNGLLESTADYYTVDLDFTLTGTFFP